MTVYMSSGCVQHAMKDDLVLFYNLGYFVVGEGLTRFHHRDRLRLGVVSCLRRTGGAGRTLLVVVMDDLSILMLLSSNNIQFIVIIDIIRTAIHI